MLGGVIGVILGWLGYHHGQRTDAANATGSAQARIKHIIDNRLQTAVGTTSDTRSSNTVMGWLNTKVKSVQRGSASRGVGDSTAYIDVTISAVDMSKSIVTLSTSCRTSTSTPDQYMVRGRLISSTYLRIEGNAKGNTDTDWEVIEFY